MTATPIDRSDRGTFFVSVFTDVSEQVATEQRLRDSEARFRTAVDTMLDGFGIYRARRDESGAIVDLICEYVNPSSIDNRGLPASETVGRGMLELFPEMVEQGLFQLFVDVIDTGKQLHIEVPNYESARVQGSFEIRAAKFDEDRCVVAFRDFTDQRQAEADLRASEARLRNLLASLPVGIALVDRQGPLYLNDVAKSLLQREVIRGIPIEQLPATYGLYRAGTEDPYPLEELPLLRAIRYGETSGAQDVVIRNDDGDVPIETTAVPLRDSAGAITHAITVFVDITERRQREAHLAAMRVELERSNEALAAFAGVAAHDLVEPLRSMIGFAQLLHDERATQLDGEAREWIDNVLESATRLRHRINDLLAYSRAGSKPLTRDRVDLAELVRRAVRELSPLVGDVNAVIEIGDLPALEVDPTELERVFENVLANALKYGVPDSEPRVTVAAARTADGWRIDVDDDGPGIPSTERERVFEPFHRLAVGAPRPGTGLGLATCRTIVERHGGRMWIDDAPGGGCRVCFTLPSEGADGH